MRSSVVGFLLLCINGLAQTGPGGIGNSTTLPAWFRADAGTSTTVHLGPVTSWTDQSGNGYTVTQAVATQQPLFTANLINSRPALFFDNQTGPNNDELAGVDNANLDNTSGLTIVTMSRPISLNNSGPRAIVSKRTGTDVQESYLMFYYVGGDKMTVDLDGLGNRFASTTTFVAGRDYAITLHYDGTLAAASRARLYVNDNLDITEDESSAAIPDYASPLTIGSLNPGDGRPFGGYIAEVAIYRKALNTAERIIVHNYLFAKYGLSASSVPATTNDIYAGDEPGNGNYDFNVAGVGEAANGGNAQASSSIAGGLQVDRVSGFEAGDYMIYGHNAGTNTVSNSDVTGLGGANPARWTRIWYFDITNANANQTADLTFDMSDGGTPVTPVTASNYVLLTRAGLAGAWTEVATASAIAGDRISFNGITIASDGYYTIGTRNYISSPLPVGLVSFEAVTTSQGVNLSWVTASELNNDYFTIERSVDGESFSPLATVPGAGTSDDENNYSVIDRFAPAGKLYYRLGQSDNDGKRVWLRTIVVYNAYELNRSFAYPNPANDHLVIRFNAAPDDALVQLYNLAGQQVPVSASRIGSEFHYDVSHLPAGLYFVRVVDSNGGRTEKVVIER